MQVLNREQIESAFDFDRAVAAIEQAYQDYSAGKINHPPVGHIVFDEFDADCHLKFGQTIGDEYFVVKLAVGVPKNIERGLPTGDGMVLVLSAKTGEALAVLHDRMFLTDMRTAIGGAIASRLLAPPDAKHLLIVGSGVQAKFQLNIHQRLVPGLQSFEVWGRNPQRVESVIEGTSAAVSADLAESCERADVIVTTTAARTPLIEREWLSKGVHITAVGADAPGKQELDSAIIADADVVVVDSVQQCVDHGEVEVAIAEGLRNASELVELGDVLAGHKPGRADGRQLTVADQTGLAAQDIAIAKSVLDG